MLHPVDTAAMNVFGIACMDMDLSEMTYRNI